MEDRWPWGCWDYLDVVASLSADARDAISLASAVFASSNYRCWVSFTVVTFDLNCCCCALSILSACCRSGFYLTSRLLLGCIGQASVRLSEEDRAASLAQHQ